ncbi:MAG: ATP-binding cassette domain-containing protein [Nitrospinaceae bacterium]|nr:ATP-binding cassette domain-containing protein [Nitrospinaceae bacterium]
MDRKRTMLKVSNLSLTKGKAILKGISFELAAGEMLTVLGPSGAGKSSLLRCLNRLDTVDAGEVLLGGQDIRSLEVTQLRRRVGMVFQVPALVPSTVAVNVALGPSLRQETLTVPQCEELLQQVGLNPALKDRMADTLSVGEQQRVALAQLLANRPEVLLLDEPTSALDPTAALTVENLIKDIHVRLNTATVLVTHDVAQARRFNAETLVILNGAVAARGNIQDLINDTGNEPLQKFFSGELTGQGPEQI